MDVSRSASVSTPAPKAPSEVTANMARLTDRRAVDKVGADFESTFLSMLLKEMRQTLEPGSLFSHDTSDVLGGLFDMFMSQHLAQGKILGIADMVTKQLAPKTKP